MNRSWVRFPQAAPPRAPDTASGARSRFPGRRERCYPGPKDRSSDPRTIRYRSVEEFYDYQADPGAWHNLIDDPRYADEIESMRTELHRWMCRTDAPGREAFAQRDDPAALAAFMRNYSAKVAREIEARKVYEERTGHAF